MQETSLDLSESEDEVANVEDDKLNEVWKRLIFSRTEEKKVLALVGTNSESKKVFEKLSRRVRKIKFKELKKKEKNIKSQATVNKKELESVKKQ